MDKFYTCEEVAEHLKVKVQTVWGWIREGRLPAVRVGKCYRVSATSLDAFLAGGETLSNESPNV